MVRIDKGVGATLQDPVEFERDEPTPLFMVCAEKKPEDREDGRCDDP